MNTILPFGLFLVGAGVGWIATSSLRAAPLPVEPTAPAEAPTRAAEAERAGLSSEGERAPDCREEAAQARELRKRLRALEPASSAAKDRSRPPSPRCAIVPWPTDLPDMYREEGMRAVIGEELRGREFELDCSEFPCVAVVRHLSEQDNPAAIFKKGSYAEARVFDFVFGMHGGSHSFLAPVPPESMNRDLWLRVERRVHSQIRELMRAAREQAPPEPTAEAKAPAAPPAPLKLVFPLPGQP